VWLGWEIVLIIFLTFNLSFAILLDNLVWAFLCACCMVAQVYRYRRVSGLVQRQQTRWVVYGVFLIITTVVTLEVPSFLFPALGPGSLYSLVSWYAILLAFIPFPLTIGIAILRYRLWDIDTLINRTLVYGTLTVLLALVYVGIILLLQPLFYIFIGRNSSFGLVVSTLAVVALFNPLRKRIQTLIDRRFYRSKYLAEQTLQALSLTLRDEMDLKRLQEELLGVVYKTIQPTDVSLWLCNPASLHAQNRQQIPRIDEKERP
jgi:hypothetical protein